MKTVIMTAKNPNDKITWKGEVISKTVVTRTNSDMKDTIFQHWVKSGYEEITVSSL